MVVQLVRIPACHAGGRGFESRPLRQYHVLGHPKQYKNQPKCWFLYCLFCFIASNIVLFNPKVLGVVDLGIFKNTPKSTTPQIGKKGLYMALTDASVKTAKSKEKDYKLSDAGGLYLYVSHNGRQVMAHEIPL